MTSSLVRRLLLGAAFTLPVALPVTARAQDAGQVEPRAVNPGAADAPADVERQLVLPTDADAGVVAAAEPVELKVDPPVEKKDDGWQLTAALGASARVSYQGATPFALDSTLRPTTIAPFMTRVRVTPEIHLGPFGLIAEADAATGAAFGAPDVTADLPAEVTTKEQIRARVPFPAFAGLEPFGVRKLYVEYKWATGAFRVGQQTSQWGLGLLANDGSRDAEAGDFGQAQFGNLTYRALLAARPFYSFGGGWRAFETVVAADLIVRDNLAEFSRGDRAFQAVLALRFAKDNDNNLGVYGVYRNQRNIDVTDGGKATDVFVIDVAGKWQLIKRHNRSFKVGFEVVGITGTTTQGRNENASLLKVGEFGGAIKSAYAIGHTTIYLDGGYASGDQNPADDRIENFRFDRDFKVGLVLFDHVLAYQSARSAARASDPNLTGTPPEGAELLGTGGSVSGAWYLFPRIKHGVTDWLDLYGGPLFAFSTAKLTDPFNTRIGGGTSLNALGGRPGGYLGTEVDLGVQARWHPVPELLITATGEGGLFLPGDAFRLPDNTILAPVGFGRVRLSVSL
jgi:hypothetical protein